MDRKRKKYFSLSERHIRRIIVNKTASDLLNISNFPNINKNFESRDDELPHRYTTNNLESMEEFEECVHDDLVNSNTVDDLESNEEPIESDIVVANTDDDTSTELDEEEADYNVGNELVDKIGTSEDNQFIEAIVSWAIIFNICHVALLALLAILRKYTSHPFPKDPRTLLKTPRHTAIVEMGPGQYCHFGLKNALTRVR